MKNKKDKLVHIILLNYNGYKDTIDCIKSLNLITYTNYKIIIVDNCSTDNSEKYIMEYIEKFSNIHFIQTGKNLGFSGGNNVAIKWALKNNAEYICLLNNDTVVEPDFLDVLVEEMENDKNIGIAGSKIMYYDNPDIIWSAGGYIDYKKSLGCHYGKDKVDSEIYNKKINVDFLTGCTQLIRKDVFYNIGLYDETYFLYMEDVDFCAKVNQSNFKLVYVPKSKIYHKVSSSTGGDESPLFLYYITRNRLLFNKKNQKNKLKSLIFYILYAMKLCKDPFTKKDKYKYVLYGVRDYFKGRYGQQNIDFR